MKLAVILLLLQSVAFANNIEAIKLTNKDCRSTHSKINLCERFDGIYTGFDTCLLEDAKSIDKGDFEEMHITDECSFESLNFYKSLQHFNELNQGA